MPVTDTFNTLWNRLKLFDRNLITYFSLLSLVILIFHQNISQWFGRFLLHLLMIAAIFFIIPWLDRKKNPVVRFIR
ncbi:MAG: hypothetical protein ACK2TU_12650, partial [Anaerolineales bacterium]